MCLGTKLRRLRPNDGVACWAPLSAKCALEAVTSTEKCVKEVLKINAFPKTGSGPWPTGHILEQDDVPELDPKSLASDVPTSGRQSFIIFVGKHWGLHP